ncbi:MAG: hypothetical protein E6L09_05200 [Verrucomicrobia bacterium]|nr:MAG: hypothetical protein E6L09_05200 [Verrucomicrobiota bacterium]
MKNSFDRKIVAGFTLALALLLAIEGLLFRSTVTDEETGQMVAHTHEVLIRIQELILRLTDAETARRGFIMTGRDRYLTHYTNAVLRVSKVFDDLRQLTRDNPQQQQKCDALEPLVRRRFAVYAESISARHPGTDNEAQMKLTEQGQAIMEEIRKLIAQMDETERVLRKSRQATASANLKKTRRIAVVGSVASVALLVWVFVMLVGENQRRQRAERALQKANEELEVRVGKRTAELTNVLAGYQRAEQEIKKLNEELERRVVERTGQLQAANNELEAFSYSVSHDLRAPLRHIGGFAEMLRQEASTALGEKSRQHLEVIAESARQMGRLIDSLLSFSRVGRTELKQTRVNMDELVREVQQEVGRDTEGRQIEWEVGPLPAVLGDRSMLKQVWVNLIGNAVKYTRARGSARIDIRCEKTPDHEWQYCVRDNGAGFDMQYAHKLFGVFQRLHRAEEFEGTGIGLANVRRIVHRHGGRTWAEGKVNEGAAFYFTLPDSPVD